MEKRELIQRLIHECPFVRQHPCAFQGIWALSKIMDEKKALNYPKDHHIDEMLSTHYSCPYYRTFVEGRSARQ